ncbi:MAG: amidohydrolase [Thermodesulfobacteria bacterium]|nr:amidohydrolase [Thermodesulfobacteriota bacterium]
MLGLKAKWIIPSAEEKPIENGCILIENGKISDIVQNEALLSDLEVYDLGEAIVFPALVNAHTHISMSIFRGIAEDLPLMVWLTQYIFPVEAKLKREWVYWGAKLSLIEMIKSGTGIFCDMYIFEPEVIKATKEAGLRATLGEGLFDFPSPGYGPLEKGFEITEELLRTYESDEFINIAVSPHTLYTCSPDTVKKCVDLAKKYEAKLHIHLCENQEELKVVKEKHGKAPIEIMQEINGLGNFLISAHCVKITDEEINLFAEKGVYPVHCPESNLKLGSGIAPIVEMLLKGVKVCLGTDGPASNNDLDMFSEMRTASLVQKGIKEDPAVISAKDVFKMATENGAEALGFNKSGRLAKGYNADLAVVDLKNSVLQPIYDPLATLVYSVKAGQISHLMIGGKWIMKDYELLTLNEEEVVQKVKEIQEEVLEILKGQSN